MGRPTYVEQWERQIDEKVKRFDRAAIHWVFTIFFSSITALVTTLLFLKQ